MTDWWPALKLIGYLLLTRYAGIGYNLLEGNPEGDFHHGGADPGIKITRFIFKHTFINHSMAYYSGQTLQVPDQVVFHMRHSCVESQSTNAYNGQKSYQKEFSVNY